MATGCFVSSGRSIHDAVERVKLAESLGYEAAYVHPHRRPRLDPGLHDLRDRDRAHPARHRRRADLLAHARDDGPGDGDDRRPLGRALQARDRRLAPPRRRVLARADDRQAGHRDARVRGDRARDPARRAAARRARSGRASSRSPGIGPFPDTPMLFAALSPNMLRLAGEIADGVVLWLCNPNYIRDVVVPMVREGREKAGKTLEGFDIVPAVPSACTDDVGAAYDAMRMRPADLLRAAVLPRDDRALGLRAPTSSATTRPAGDVERDEGGDLRRVPRDPDGDRRRGRRARRRRALRRRGRHLALRRADPEDRLRGDAARRRARADARDGERRRDRPRAARRAARARDRDASASARRAHASSTSAPAARSSAACRCRG